MARRPIEKKEQPVGNYTFFTTIHISILRPKSKMNIIMRNIIFTLRVAGLFIFLFLFIHRASAQAVTIKGTIRDPAGKPLQYANVLLLKSLDSSLVKGTISDSSGQYSFENIE